MIFKETHLKGSFIIEPEILSDERGAFARIFCQKEYEKYGINRNIAQCSISINTKKFTNSFLNSLHKFNIPLFVKFFLLIDEYYENIQFNKNIYIVSLQNITSNILKNNTIYISFLILYIKKEYVIQIQFLNNLFRMKLKHNNNPINLYKPLNENDILLLLTKKNNNLVNLFFK